MRIPALFVAALMAAAPAAARVCDLHCASASQTTREEQTVARPAAMPACHGASGEAAPSDPAGRCGRVASHDPGLALPSGAGWSVAAVTTSPTIVWTVPIRLAAHPAPFLAPVRSGPSPPILSLRI